MLLNDLINSILALFRRAVPVPTALPAPHDETTSPAQSNWATLLVSVPMMPSTPVEKPEVVSDVPPSGASGAASTQDGTKAEPAVPQNVPSAKADVPQPPIIQAPAEFIAAISLAAQACMRRTGVPASVTVAQAALESSWGKRAPGFNLFGIKADLSWQGLVTEQVTHEVVNGKSIEIMARFRAYDGWQGSIDDHADFLRSNPRYHSAFDCKNGPDFARAIARAGYATDPLYADKLIAIMSTRNLGMLDIQE
ncbi:glycoside hydrolase family 73 protein [Burkholderia pseudomallei]|uniref:glycoside hydrolase family 73 protein n=1 Tax=Burkholderia pseudomallei TaxID=28450 RepID=UPI001E587BCB|nr:glycoside hydrolase family 73 protein [Burkholderia pseudomallei]